MGQDGHGRKQKFALDSLEKAILIVLVAFFASKVVASVNRWRECNVGLHIRAKYEKHMVYPTITICPLTKHRSRPTPKGFPVLRPINNQSILQILRYSRPYKHRLIQY